MQHHAINCRSVHFSSCTLQTDDKVTCLHIKLFGQSELPPQFHHSYSADKVFIYTNGQQRTQVINAFISEYLYTFQYYDHTPKVIYDLTTNQYGYLAEQIKARQERLFAFKGGH